MTEPGKNAPGLKGFPTPNTADDVSSFLLFLFPDSSWSQYILGAVKALEVGYNWYESGDLDVDEAAEALRLINEQAPYNKYPAPTLPTGGKVIRITEDGTILEENDNGEWVEPTGDYAIPPVPSRSGGSPNDLRCIASANCANVLQQLYEQLSDDWNNGVSTAQAITNFILALAAFIGAEFGLIFESVVAIAALVFNVLYETLQYIGADLWDTNFTDAMKCILYDCSAIDAGVVTFSMDCVNNALASQVNLFDLSASQLRLFGQLQFIFQFIGQDGLNAAGATTAITTANCDACSGWCITVDLTDNDGTMTVYASGQGLWSSGVGWVATDTFLGGVDRTLAQLVLDLGGSFDLTEIGMLFDWAGGSQSGGIQAKYLFTDNFAHEYGIQMVTTDQEDETLIWTLNQNRHEIDFLLQCSINAHGGSATLKSVTIRGTGDKPTISGWVDC